MPVALALAAALLVPAQAIEMSPREAALAERLSGAVLAGWFTLDGQDMAEPLHQDRYTLGDVTKVRENGLWRFEARVQYGEKDVRVPIPVFVRWADDETPVLSVTSLAIPGLGSYTARVTIHAERYAGIWFGDDHGGHMFGYIEEAEPAAPVEPRDGPAVESWSQWRGPNADGSTAASNLPVRFSRRDNVAWVTDLPGESAATPAVRGDMVFLTSTDDDTDGLLAMAVDRSTGHIAWQHEAGAARPSPRRGFENTHGECSPVADDERVYFLFGTGLLVAYDHGGTELWRRDLAAEYAPFNLWWEYGSSPVLVEGVLIVQVLHDGESYLLGVEPETGVNRYRHIREHTATGECPQAYTTPIVWRNGDRTEVLVLGADCVTAHDPATGEEFWRWTGINPRGNQYYRCISSPVTAPGGIVMVTSPQGNDSHGLRVRGDDVEEVWTLRRPTPDVVTPLCYDGRLYTIDGKGRQRIACLEPETGEVIWEESLKTNEVIRSSPTAADGKIYIMDASGLIHVLRAGDTFEILATIELDAYPSRASIVIDRDQLLVRSADALYWAEVTE